MLCREQDDALVVGRHMLAFPSLLQGVQWWLGLCCIWHTRGRVSIQSCGHGQQQGSEACLLSSRFLVARTERRRLVALRVRLGSTGDQCRSCVCGCYGQCLHRQEHPSVDAMPWCVLLPLWQWLPCHTL